MLSPAADDAQRRKASATRQVWNKPKRLWRYEQEYPEAMKCLATDVDEVLTALRFPESASEVHPNDEFIGVLIWRGPSAVQSRAPVHE